MDRLHTIHARIASGEELTEADHDFIGYLSELIDDARDIAEGEASASAQSIERASGPALAIVVGHTNLSKGASGADAIGEREYPWNTDLADKMMVHCQNIGVEAKVFYRDGVGISGAYANVLEYGAACAVELHFNSFNGSVAGTETLYDNDTNANSKQWAQDLQDAMVELYGRTGNQDRGLKERDEGDRGYKSVSAIDLPTALIEPFFGDNDADAGLGQSLKDELASTLANVALQRLGAGF